MSRVEWDISTPLSEAIEQAMNTVGAARGLPPLSWMVTVDGALLGWADDGSARDFRQQLEAITPWLHALDMTISGVHDMRITTLHEWVGTLDEWTVRIHADERKAAATPDSKITAG